MKKFPAAVLSAAAFLSVVLPSASACMGAAEKDFGFIRDIEPYSVKMMLSEMARNPQAATYCRRITEAVERLAYTPLTAQEQAFLSEQLPQQPMLSPFLMAR